MSSESGSNETRAVLKVRYTGDIKVAFTNIDDGVSLLQELELGIRFLTRWTVTETATEVQKIAESETTGYALEEKHTVQNAPLTWRMYKLSGSYNSLTSLLMTLFKNVAANEGTVNMAGGGLSYFDNGKFKHD